jgi:hypothetical protein
MRDAPRIITVELEGLVCKAMAPECTIPIRTGRRATTRKARKFPKAVAISKEGWGRVHQRQAARSEDEVTSAAHREGPRNSGCKPPVIVSQTKLGILKEKGPVAERMH